MTGQPFFVDLAGGTVDPSVATAGQVSPSNIGATVVKGGSAGRWTATINNGVPIQSKIRTWVSVADSTLAVVARCIRISNTQLSIESDVLSVSAGAQVSTPTDVVLSWGLQAIPAS